jgi:hypothetical protein
LVVSGDAAGFAFFLTRTPFSDFFTSFLGGGLGFVFTAETVTGSVVIGDGLAAFSLAATALLDNETLVR